MTDPFTLSVDYKGTELALTAQLELRGYTHLFKVQIDDTDVYFEPDEEGIYRVVRMPGQEEKQLLAIDRHLLGLVQEKIAELLA